MSTGQLKLPLGCVRDGQELAVHRLVEPGGHLHGDAALDTGVRQHANPCPFLRVEHDHFGELRLQEEPSAVAGLRPLARLRHPLGVFSP